MQINVIAPSGRVTNFSINLLDSSGARATWTSTLTAVEMTVNSAAHELLPMPAGTQLTATAIDMNTADGSTCSVLSGPTNSPIANIQPTNSPDTNLATIHRVNLRDCRAGDQVQINVIAPSRQTTNFTVIL